MGDFGDSGLPKSIGSLVELNRLMIGDNDFMELPDSICRLTNLNELIIQTSLKTLPKDFGNLTNLRFFFLNHSFGPIPQSYGALIPRCTMNVYLLVTQPDSCHGAVGWLKEFNDLKGALLISNIKNITSIDDVRNANLISMHKLEALLLIWDESFYKDDEDDEFTEFNHFMWDAIADHLKDPIEYWLKKGILGISVNISKDGKHLRRKDDDDILENFQPYHNLKKLLISCYHGREFPRWMGDPLSCSSLEKLWIESCPSITLLPLANVLTLKYLGIQNCHGLLHLKRESLPSLLKHLRILDCYSLVEVALLESLVKLEISGCDMLESLLTVHLKTLEAASASASASSECANGYCHFKPSNESKRIPSLKKMKIKFCPRLVIKANQIVLEEDCKVNIYYCKNLKDWCREHNYTDPAFKHTHEEIHQAENEDEYSDRCDEWEFRSCVARHSV